MTARAVHWHEGMFLQPHQFQAEHRYLTARAHRAGSWPTHHVWGLRTVEVDPDALANNRFVVRSLRAVFRDGTPIEVPTDGLLPTLELKGLFEPGQPLMVYLATPALNLGKANISEDVPDPNARYRLDTQELEDENTGVNPQPIRVRLHNLRLLVGDQDQTGFATLPLVRLVKSALANAPPEIDVSYIPPVLACDTWPALHGDILQGLFDRIGRKRERLASALAARGGALVGTDPQDAVSAAHLRELNESYAVLSVVAFTPGIPPLTAYTELCRLVGQLAIFDRSGRWPAIPPYDHDDLGGCFYRVKVYLDTLLDILPEPEYKERPFIGMGLRMQAAIEPTWLDPAWELYLGVRSEMDPDEMMRLLTVPGQLDMKVGSGDRVDAIYQLGQAGLRFEPCPRPGLLPDLAGQRYCRVSRLPEREWGAVTRSLTVAVRFNETRVVGAIQGQRTVTVRAGGGRTNTMQFTLYAVPAG
ncbi:type VI secretion system baseplate subunit TssK [Gemmata sp. G18]|uniref:Type VI secretion system baseplate subunit TssK n=1 Tax=Gemmata palustris TaxID=2822762 RepID=A0ABS5BU76_9BACT|nr:type VI secretion system baseplate subunit TssK [Gemmata palustris]MBP3957276.1 type VI secretion system baseplate subunit TssK [Gemmata palustris]